MTQAIRFGLDLAKSVVQVHGVDAAGAVVVRRQLRRGQVLKFFSLQPAALIGVEACGSAHHWGRELSALGHDVRLMPAAYVKAYVKRNKNDARDAEAACEAVGRPTMRFVPVKSVEQQCGRALHRVRDLLVRQRTQLANAIRGQLYEMGLTGAKGAGGMTQLLRRIEAGDAAIPPALLVCLAALARQWRAVDAEIGGIDREILEQVRANSAAQRLMAIPGGWAYHRACGARRHWRRPAVRERPRLRRLGRPDPPQPRHRRQTPAHRPHQPGRRPRAATVAGARRQLLAAPGQGPRQTHTRRRLRLDPQRARQAAGPGRRRRPGSQDRPRHLGGADLRAELSGAGRGLSRSPALTA